MPNSIWDYFTSRGAGATRGTESNTRAPAQKLTLNERLKLEARFVSVPKERINEPRFALRGEALARYERTQKLSKQPLPEKAPAKVQTKAIKDTVAELKAARNAAMNRILGKAAPDENGPLPVIPRTVRCTLGKKAVEDLEKKKTGDGELQGSFKVRLGDVKHFLVPDKSLTAPADPVLHFVRQYVKNRGGNHE